MSRQNKESLLQVVYDNGTQHVLTSKTLQVYNMRFYAQAVKYGELQARDGTLYPGTRGYRITATINLDATLQASDIKELLDYCSNDTDILYHSTITGNSGAPSNTVIIDSAPTGAPSKLPKMLIVIDNTEKAMITAYNQISQTVTMSQSLFFTTNLPVEIYISQNLPRYIRFAPDTNAANLLTYVLDSVEYGYNRDGTINRQNIKLTLQSRDLLAKIPSYMIV